MEFRPVSPEEVQNTMQFRPQQQAQFAADSARTEGRLDRLTDRVDRVADAVLGLTSVVGNLADMFKRYLRDDHGLQTS